MKPRSPRLLIFLTIFVDLLGFGIVIPIAAYIGEDYVTDGFFSREAQLGLLMASYSFCQMIFAPIWGRLSDRVGRRPILLLSLFGSVVSYAMFGFARSFTMLLVARIFAGVCGANITAAQAYIADVTEPEKRTSAMGLIGMAFGMGFALGPVLGAGMSALGEQLSPGIAAQTYPGLCAAAICLVNLVWATFGLPESLPPEKRGKVVHERRLAPFSVVLRSLSHRTIGPLVGVFFLSTLAFSNMEVALGLYAKLTEELQMTTTGIYGIFIYIGILLAFMHGYVVRKLVKFVPEAVLVVIGTFAQGVALLIFPIIPSITCMLVSLAILSFGQGVCVPALLGLVSQSTDSTRQGQVMGVTQSASSMARIIGPLCAMGVWQASGSLASPFYAGGLIMFAAVAMAVLTRRRILQRPLMEASPSEEGA